MSRFSMVSACRRIGCDDVLVLSSHFYVGFGVDVMYCSTYAAYDSCVSDPVRRHTRNFLHFFSAYVSRVSVCGVVIAGLHRSWAGRWPEGSQKGTLRIPTCPCQNLPPLISVRRGRLGYWYGIRLQHNHKLNMVQAATFSFATSLITV